MPPQGVWYLSGRLFQYQKARIHHIISQRNQRLVPGRTVPSFNRRSVFEFHDQAGISAEPANERSDLAAGDNASPGRS